MDFREVLVAVWLLDDEERRAALLEEGKEIIRGYYVNYAFNAPKELASADRRYNAKLLVPPSRRMLASDSEALRDVKEQLRAAGRI